MKTGRSLFRPVLGLLFADVFLLVGCSSVPPQPGRLSEPTVTITVPPPRGNPVVVATAKAMIGIPYRFGGDSPEEGFDCSGLVQYAYQQAGWHVPRTAREQFRDLIPLPPLEMDPGDLVFFRPPETRNLHVGIYLGDSKFIHAPSTGKRIRFASLDSPYWRSCFLGGGRPYLDKDLSNPLVPTPPITPVITAKPIRVPEINKQRMVVNKPQPTVAIRPPASIAIKKRPTIIEKPLVANTKSTNCGHFKPPCKNPENNNTALIFKRERAVAFRVKTPGLKQER